MNVGICLLYEYVMKSYFTLCGLYRQNLSVCANKIDLNSSDACPCCSVSVCELRENAPETTPHSKMLLFSTMLLTIDSNSAVSSIIFLAKAMATNFSRSMALGTWMQLSATCSLRSQRVDVMEL